MKRMLIAIALLTATQAHASRLDVQCRQIADNYNEYDCSDQGTQCLIEMHEQQQAAVNKLISLGCNSAFLEDVKE